MPFVGNFKVSVSRFRSAKEKLHLRSFRIIPAFPAIGCGGFGIPADVIATIMIDAVQDQLSANPTTRLTVTFVIQQKIVYDTFQENLKPSSTRHRHRSPSPERSPKLDRVNITLTTASANLDIARKLLTLYQQLLNP